MPSAGFNIRLSASNERAVRKALENLGKEGQSALAKIDKAAKQANDRGLRSFNRGLAEGQRAMGAYASRLGPLGAALTALGPTGLAAAAGIAVLTVGLGKTVAAGTELEKSAFKIQALLKTTEQASGQTLESIETLARRIGLATLASTAEVREAAAQLLTFKAVSGDAFGRTLTLAQDLSAAMGTQLKSSVLQLAKALEDPERNLSQLNRSGISFNLTQIEMVKNLKASGREAEALGVILSVIEGQVAGAGAGEAEGLAGAWDSLTESMGFFFEGISEHTGLMEGLTAFLRSLASGAESANAALFATPSQQLAAAEAQLAALQAAAAAPPRSTLFESSAQGPAGNRQSMTLGATPGPGLSGGRVQTRPAGDPDPVAAKLRVVEALRLVVAEEKRINALAAERGEIATAQRAADAAAAKAKKEAAKADAADNKARLSELHKQVQQMGKLREQEAKREASLEAFLVGLETEAELATLTTAQREVQLALINAQKVAGKELNDVERERVETAVRAGQAARDAQDAARRAQAEAEKAAQEVTRLAEGVTGTIESGFHDAFFSIFRGSENRDLVGDFLDFVQDGFARLLADMATMALIRPIVLPIVTSLVGGGAAGALVGGGGPLGGGGGGGFNIPGLNLFSGSITDSLNAFGTNLGFSGFTGGVTSGFDAAGFISAGGRFGPSGANLFGATTFGQFLGAAGLGFGAGTLINSLFGGNPLGGTIGSGIGSLGGAVFGSIFPGIGTLLGGLIGGGLGGFFGGLFGGGESVGPNATASFGVTDGRISILDARADNDGDVSRAVALAETAAEVLNRIADLADITFLGENAGAVGFEQEGFFSLAPGGREHFDSAEQAVADFVARTLAGGGFSGELADVVRRSAQLDSSLERLTADVALARAIFDDGLFDQEELSQGEQAIKALSEAFADATERAEELGLSVERVAELRAEALQALTTGFDESIRLQLLAITDPFQAQLEALADAQEQRLKDAIALSADLVEVERLSGLERLRIVEAEQERLQAVADQGRVSFTTAASQIVDFINAQRLGGTSTLSPTDRLTEAQRQFGGLLSQVREGRTGLAGSLTQSAAALISIGRENFASTVNFANLESNVISSLLTISENFTDQGFVDQQIEAIRQQTAADSQNTQQVVDSVELLRREIQLLRQQMALAA